MNRVKALLAIVAALLVIAHPWAVLVVLAAELVVLAVIAAGIARAAGYSPCPFPWRSA